MIKPDDFLNDIQRAVFDLGIGFADILAQDADAGIIQADAKKAEHD